MEPAGQDRLVQGLLAEGLADDLPLSIRDRAVLTYADQLTVAPSSLTPDDIIPLRAAGLDDRAIHDLCSVVAYFAFVNRIADGLGVELEPPAGPSGQVSSPSA